MLFMFSTRKPILFASCLFRVNVLIVVDKIRPPFKGGNRLFCTPEAHIDCFDCSVKKIKKNYIK